MPRQITDIIETIINEMTFESVINAVTDNVDGTFTIEVCETFHAQPVCSSIVIGTESYKVTQVVNNTSITFTASVAPVGTTFSIEGPKYLHGTRIAINNEIDKRSEANVKTFPLVFVWEIIREIFELSDMSIIERHSDLSIFFLAQRKPGVDKTDTLYTNVIDPMTNLAHGFLSFIKKHCLIGELDKATIVNYAKFGVPSEEGAKTAFFNSELGGVELRIDLPILKDFSGNGACDC